MNGLSFEANFNWIVIEFFVSKTGDETLDTPHRPETERKNWTSNPSIPRPIPHYHAASKVLIGLDSFQRLLSANHPPASVVYSSSGLWPTGSSWGHDGRLSRDPLPVFFWFCFAGDYRKQFLRGQRCRLFGDVRLTFPLPTTSQPITASQLIFRTKIRIVAAIYSSQLKAWHRLKIGHGAHFLITWDIAAIHWSKL